jgi:hypothetical protein
MVKRSCVSLMLVGSERGRAGAVGTGTGVVTTGIGTAVASSAGMVVGAGEGVGWGSNVWVHPAVASRTTIVQESATSNQIFIHPDSRFRRYSV